MFGNLACCCSCTPHTLGFAGATWTGLMGCCAQWTAIASMGSDLSRLNECTAIFCGHRPQGSCGLIDQFTDSGTIATWVYGGGRVYVAGEWKNGATDCLNLGHPNNRSDLNSFLSAIGSSMSFSSADHVTGTSCTIADEPSTIPPLMEGLHIATALTGVVTGGTAIGLETGDVLAAVEKVGDGFVVCVADCNLWDECITQNCGWITRFIEGAASDIL